MGRTRELWVVVFLAVVLASMGGSARAESVLLEDSHVEDAVLGPVTQDTTIWRDWNSTCGDAQYATLPYIDVSTRKDLPNRFHRTLVEFALPDPGQCAVVNSAQLRLYAYSQSEYITNQFLVDAVITPWTASSSTWCVPWSNPGGDWTSAGEAMAVVPSKCPENGWHWASCPYDEWIEWDVTSIVADWMEGVRPNYGFIIRQFDIYNSSENQAIGFRSSEYTEDPTLAPQLLVTCSGSDPCDGAPDGTTCDDGDACTQVDTCRSGSCVGSDPVTCAALDQCHDIGVCDSVTGLCSNPAKPNGTPCDDADARTVNDVCTDGVCSGVDLCAGVICTALDQCHEVGLCDHLTGQCSNPTKADGTACDDGNPDTVNDVCTAGACHGIPRVRFDYPVGSGECSNYPLRAYRVTWDFLDPGYTGSCKAGEPCHTGEDWNRGAGDAERGDPVCAVGPGRVITARSYSSWSNIIVIEHVMSDGTTKRWSQYAHLETMFVGEGQQVVTGQKIGTIGKQYPKKACRQDGWYCAHLHFEIRQQPVPPNNWPADEQTVRQQYLDPTDKAKDVDPSSRGFIEQNR